MSCKGGLTGHLWILITRYMLVLPNPHNYGQLLESETSVTRPTLQNWFLGLDWPLQATDLSKKNWAIFPYQKRSFNEECFSRSEIMIDCNTSLVTEMVNENKWQAYIYQHGKKQLSNIKMLKEMNSGSLNASFINIIWISMYSLYIQKEQS